MNKKLMLIINPAAGRGGYKLNLPDALHLLDRGGFRTTLFFTAGRGDATEFAAAHGEEYDVVACIGGDGTLSEVLSGLMRLEHPPKVGYIPMGTANDVATTLDLPKNDTVGAATPQDQKKVLGHLAYVLQGMAQLPKIEAYKARVEYDDGVVEGRFLYGSMSNSTSVAGIVRLKEEMVSLGDGMSELVLVREPIAIDGFGAIAASVLAQTFDCDDLVILHTKKAKFTFEKPVAWTRDGEDGGAHTELELCNYHAPVELIF